jgi:predicted TIM-barrel fold metal-dependent hydrolase
MYEKDGERYFIVDGHIHFWDASPANQANKYGTGFIRCFYDYHQNLSPPEYKWPLEKFEQYTEEDLLHDIFEVGYADVAIFQPTYLTDFYTNGFNTTEQTAAVAEKYPGKFIVNGAFDPRDGEGGLRALESLVNRYQLKGVKLYTAEWKGESRGWRLDSPEAYRYLDKCRELGVSNVHVHKGPTIWPLNRDAFDVADVDGAATDFPELNFIVEHVGLPRLEDFCWIGTQEPNVYGGRATSPRSSASSATGSTRTGCCSAATTRSGNRSGSSNSSSTSRSRTTCSANTLHSRRMSSARFWA